MSSLREICTDASAMLRVSCQIGLFVCFVVVVGGCGGGPVQTQGAPPKPDAPSTSEVDAPRTGPCPYACLAEMSQAVFRFTAIDVLQPSGPLSQLLDSLWGPDIDHYILNIMLRVRSIDPLSGAMVLESGSGWYEPYAPVADVTQVHEEDIRWFCHLGGVSTSLPLTSPVATQIDDRCAFTSQQESILIFHTGPLDQPLLCGPEQIVPNSIPILRIQASARISDDCQQFNDAHLQGCISVAAARNICFCQSYDCARNADPESSKTCTRLCGADRWINFGEFVEQFGHLEPNCDVNQTGTNDGYIIEGRFEATRLPPDKYNPVKSADCTVTQ